jgi:hypothetical protein
MTWRSFSALLTVLLVGCAATVVHVNETMDGHWTSIHAPYTAAPHSDVNGRQTA